MLTPREVGRAAGLAAVAVLLPHVLAAASFFDPLPGPGVQPGRAEMSWLLDRAVTYLRVHARLAEARPLGARP